MPIVANYAEFAPLDVKPTDRVFVLTGAGVSAESGLQTFRDANGLWENNRVEEVASPQAWKRDPVLVWRFYSLRRRQALQVAPNAAHVALAKLERRLGNALFLCTQNVDPLHERAGSRAVVHMHGELLKSRCERDHAQPFSDDREYLAAEAIPRCSCGGNLRPHICWFGEVPFEMERISVALQHTTLLITIGSSGSVYPAAGFVQTARRINARTVYIGMAPPDNATAFDECRLGPASEAVPHAFDVCVLSGKQCGEVGG